MAIPDRLVCSSHTISGVLPGAAVPARHGFDARARAAAAAGYSGLCLHIHDYRAQRAAGRSDAELRAVLAAAGMAEVSLEFLTGWFLDGAAADRARADEAAAYDAARAFGAHTLNVGADFHGHGIPFAVMRERFAALCRRAEGEGLTVALEMVPWSDVATIDAALAMTDGIGNAGLVIDSWHVFRGGIPLADLARIPAGRIACIQVNDAAATLCGTLAEDTLHRLPCGKGVFDLPAFVAALDRAGAAVPLSVEIISPDFAALDLDTACRTSAEGARRLLAGLRGA